MWLRVLLSIVKKKLTKIKYGKKQTNENRHKQKYAILDDRVILKLAKLNQLAHLKYNVIKNMCCFCDGFSE